jgi:GH25 family lysozyme M1 (1,4-beta-N-acetylmuramidase)
LLEHLAGYELTYPVVIDVEAISTTNPRTQDMTREEWTNVTIAFCERIKEAGHTPMIYGNLRSFFLMLDMSRLEAYEKWFAYFRTPIYFPYAHSIWQYTEKGKVDGIDTDVDLNVGFKRFGS